MQENISDSSGYMRSVRERLSERLSEFDISKLIASTRGNLRFADVLYNLIEDQNEAVAFMALRVLCRFSADSLLFLSDRSDELVDSLLSEQNAGKRRMLLSLLYKLPVSEAYKRVDFIDLCFSGINSAEPPAIRALCLKHCHALVDIYPWLSDELKSAIDLLDSETVSPAIKSVRNHIVNKCNPGV